jgi:hypothetical protein
MNFVNLIRKESKNDQNKYLGGGIAIGIYKDLNYIDISDTIPPQLQKTTEMLAVKIFHPLFTLVIVNIYIPNSKQHKKRNPNLLNDWTTELNH